MNPNRRSSVCPPPTPFTPLYASQPTSHSVSLPRLLQPASSALCQESQLLGLSPDSAASLLSGFGSHTPFLCLFAVSLLGYKKNIWCWFLLCDTGRGQSAVVKATGFRSSGSSPHLASYLLCDLRWEFVFSELQFPWLEQKEHP